MSDEHGEDREVTYGLLMPFVVTISHGGPFDDAAFVAGWEMGELHQKCRMMVTLNLATMDAMIRRANLPQADLIAMNCGLELYEHTGPLFDDTEWVEISLQRAMKDIEL